MPVPPPRTACSYPQVQSIRVSHADTKQPIDPDLELHYEERQDPDRTGQVYASQIVLTVTGALRAKSDPQLIEAGTDVRLILVANRVLEDWWFSEGTSFCTSEGNCHVSKSRF